MTTLTQIEKAKAFLELHKKDKLLILPNIWDPAGARILQAKGYSAIATASAAISSMFGYRDGERIKLSTQTEMLKRIAGSVDIPVTADVEAGYASNVAELKDSITQIIETGIVGINFEDGITNEENLRPINEQCERIAAIREVSDKMGLHLVINARNDSFLLKTSDNEEQRIEESVKRLNEYIKAGADCVFPAGAKQKETLLSLRKRISSPINVIATPGALSLAELHRIGINRVSFGPYIFRSVMKKFEKIIEELYNMGSYECFTSELLTYDEMSKYLRNEKEF